MNKKYLVCYFYWAENKSGFGNCMWTSESGDTDIYTEEEIRATEKDIIDKNCCSGVVIQNIIPLND